MGVKGKGNRGLGNRCVGEIDVLEHTLFKADFKKVHMGQRIYASVQVWDCVRYGRTSMN